MLHFFSRGSMPPNATNKLFAPCKYSQLSKLSLKIPPPPPIPPEPRNEILDTPLYMKLQFFYSRFFQNTHETAAIVQCLQKILNENYPIAGIYLKYRIFIQKMIIIEFF